MSDFFTAVSMENVNHFKAIEILQWTFDRLVISGTTLNLSVLLLIFHHTQNAIKYNVDKQKLQTDWFL